MRRRNVSRFVVPLAAGFSFGNAFAHWSLRHFDAAGWTALAFGMALFAMALVLDGKPVRCSCGCPKVGDGCDCRFCNEPYPTDGAE